MSASSVFELLDDRLVALGAICQFYSAVYHNGMPVKYSATEHRRHHHTDEHVSQFGHSNLIIQFENRLFDIFRDFGVHL